MVYCISPWNFPAKTVFVSSCVGIHSSVVGFLKEPPNQQIISPSNLVEHLLGMSCDPALTTYLVRYLVKVPEKFIDAEVNLWTSFWIQVGGLHIGANNRFVSRGFNLRIHRQHIQKHPSSDSCILALVLDWLICLEA